MNKITHENSLKMENLEKLKSAIFMGLDTSINIEQCYFDFLSSFERVSATIFFNLLLMLRGNKRVEEILQVYDFIRFPVKKAQQ